MHETRKKPHAAPEPRVGHPWPFALNIIIGIEHIKYSQTGAHKRKIKYVNCLLKAHLCEQATARLTQTCVLNNRCVKAAKQKHATIVTHLNSLLNLAAM